ncbi:MAG: helix-turn-helix transcriptional regulator [Nocardioidaceae bacterium]
MKNSPAPSRLLGPRPAGHRTARLAPLSTGRAAVLDVLTEQPGPWLVETLAGATQLHPNTVREHLDGLVRAGVCVRFRGDVRERGRPPWLYAARDQSPTCDYAGLASALAGHLSRTSASPRSEAVEAGQAWGRELISPTDPPIPTGRANRPIRAGRANRTTTETSLPVAAAESAVASSGDPPSPSAQTSKRARRATVDLLTRMGFAPEADRRAGTVRLTACPLLEAAYRSPEVVCGVHLGIVRGALAALGGTSEGTSIEPFAEPGACRLHLLRPKTRKAAGPGPGTA